VKLMAGRSQLPPYGDGIRRYGMMKSTAEESVRPAVTEKGLPTNIIFTPYSVDHVRDFRER